MPLIDEQTRVTDRRPRAVWPWVAVIVVLSLVWIVFALAVSSMRRTDATVASQPAPLAPVAGVTVPPVMAASYLQSAQQSAASGRWLDAANMLRYIPPGAPFAIDERHSYYRLGAQALENCGHPEEAAKFHEAFLSWGTALGKKGCRGCHSTAGGQRPYGPEELLESGVGASFAADLNAAGKLEARLFDLRDKLKKRPKDSQILLRLYHLEAAKADVHAKDRAAAYRRAVGAK